jgi:hypothetical protein
MAWYLRYGLRSSKSVRSQYTTTESSASGNRLRGMKFGEWKKPLGECGVASGLRSFLRGAAFQLSDLGARATQNHYGRLNDFSEKHGTTGAGMAFPRLTPETTPGAPLKPTNILLTPNRWEFCSCTSLKPLTFRCVPIKLTRPSVPCFPSRRLDKYVGQ